MTVLENDIAAFDRMRAELEAKHYKQWVVFHHGRLIDAFSEFEDAAATAVDRFDTEAPISSARLALRQPCSFRAAWSSRPLMSSTQAGFKRGKAGASAADLLVQLGPTLLVDLGLRSRSAAGQKPDLPRKRVKALIDTGAGGDCIDDELAMALNLPITDEGEISGVGGKHHAYIYTARLYIPQLDRLLFQPFTGVKLQEGEQWHRVILGRSFLRRYYLVYSGATGEVEIRDHKDER